MNSRVEIGAMCLAGITPFAVFGALLWKNGQRRTALAPFIMALLIAIIGIIGVAVQQ